MNTENYNRELMHKQLVVSTLAHTLGSGLFELKEYAEDMEETFASKLKEHNSWVTKQTSELDEKGNAEFYNIYSGDYWMLKDIFPNVFRSSLLILFYSTLEQELLFLCNYIQADNNIIKLDDYLRICKPRGNFVEQMRKFLKEKCKIKFPDKSSNWRKIKTFNIIRNNIVHNGGRLDINKIKSGSKIERYINDNSKLITIDSLRRINLSKEFIRDVIKTIELFFNELFDACKLFYENPKVQTRR